MKTLRWNRLIRPALVVSVLLFALVASSPGISACEFETEWHQTFYSGPDYACVVGECHRYCFGWPTCSGQRTDYYTSVEYSCGSGSCSP
jgi:hypothetical protein